jgi:hypothetical protein
MYFVYIARAPANTLYIRVTANPDPRIEAHNTARGPNGSKPIVAPVSCTWKLTQLLVLHGNGKSNLRSGREPRKKRLSQEIFTALKSLSRSKSTPATKSEIEDAPAMQ